MSHEFNHSIEVITPKKGLAPEIIRILNGVKYFKGMEFPINLVQGYCKGWNMLSEGTRIDLDDSVAILAKEQKLIVCTTQTTHERLGLVGKKSVHCPGMWRSFVDLSEETQSRTLSSLKKLPVFSILACCEDQALSLPPHYSACDLDVEVVPINRLKVPKLSGTHSKEDVEGVLEWSGLVLTGALFDSNSLKDFVSEYSPSFESESEERKGNVVRFKGMISAAHCLKVVDGLNEILKKEECEWIVLVVRGFDDAPVSFGLREHGYGENLYMFFILPNDEYYGYVIVGENEEIPL